MVDDNEMAEFWAGKDGDVESWKRCFANATSYVYRLENVLLRMEELMRTGRPRQAKKLLLMVAPAIRNAEWRQPRDPSKDAPALLN